MSKCPTNPQLQVVGSRDTTYSCGIDNNIKAQPSNNNYRTQKGSYAYFVRNPQRTTICPDQVVIPEEEEDVGIIYLSGFEFTMAGSFKDDYNPNQVQEKIESGDDVGKFRDYSKLARDLVARPAQPPITPSNGPGCHYKSVKF